MQDEPVIFVSGLQYTGGPEQEEKFNRWFEEEHVPIQLKARGLRKAVRYKITEPFDNPIIACKPEDYPEYVGVYEFENEAAYQEYRTGPVYDEVHQNVLKTWPEGRPFKLIWRVAYKALKTWEQ